MACEYEPEIKHEINGNITLMTIVEESFSLMPFYVYRIDFFSEENIDLCRSSTMEFHKTKKARLGNDFSRGAQRDILSSTSLENSEGSRCAERSRNRATKGVFQHVNSNIKQ